MRISDNFSSLCSPTARMEETNGRKTNARKWKRMKENGKTKRIEANGRCQFGVLNELPKIIAIQFFNEDPLLAIMSRNNLVRALFGEKEAATHQVGLVIRESLTSS